MITKQYMTAAEVAAFLEVGIRQVQNLRDRLGGIYEGKGPGRMVLLFPRERVLSFEKPGPGWKKGRPRKTS